MKFTGSRKIRFSLFLAGILAGVFVVMLAAILLFTLTACGKTQPPAASDKWDSAVQQTEQQNDAEISASEDSSPHGDEVSAEAPWKAALAEDLFEKYGVLPEYYEELGDGIYQVYVEVGGEVIPFVTVDSATGDDHG